MIFRIFHRKSLFSYTHAFSWRSQFLNLWKWWNLRENTSFQISNVNFFKNQNFDKKSLFLNPGKIRDTKTLVSDRVVRVNNIKTFSFCETSNLSQKIWILIRKTILHTNLEHFFRIKYIWHQILPWLDFTYLSIN